MKKLMFLLCISAGLSAVTPTTSPTTSPTKKKNDGALKVTREAVFREKEKEGVDRKQARKSARKLVKQLFHENDAK